MKGWGGAFSTNWVHTRIMDEDGPVETTTSTMTKELNDTMAEYVQEEEEHVYDAVTSLLLNVTIIGCLVFAYYVKKFRIYYLPESAGSLIVGMILGGIARISTDRLVLFEFVSCVYVCALVALVVVSGTFRKSSIRCVRNIGATLTLFPALSVARGVLFRSTPAHHLRGGIFSRLEQIL